MDSDYYFDLKKAGIYRALKWEKFFGLCRLLQKLFFILLTVVLLLFLYDFLGENFLQELNQSLLGGIILFLCLGIICQLKVAFFEEKLKNPIIKNEKNLAEFLTFEAARVVSRGRLDDRQLDAVFHRLLLDPAEIKKIKVDFQPAMILETKKEVEKLGRRKIELRHLLVQIVKTHPVFQEILVKNNLKFEDVKALAWWLRSLELRAAERKKWWEYRNLLRRGSLAKEWTAGYTLTLDRYSIDWTEIARKRGFPKIIGHQSEIETAERILARREYNNVLVVGEPGSGRKSIVQGLVLKTVLGESLPQVNYKRVVELDLPSFFSSITDPEQMEAVLNKIFQEVVAAGNIILVIDEFHNFIGVKPGPGRADISGVIASYLHLSQFQIVAVTTYAGLHRNLEQNPSILNLFEKIENTEPSEKEVLMILENLSLILEEKYQLFISYPTLRHIIDLSQRFLSSQPFPKKAVDLLDEIVIYVKKSTKDKVVKPEHVASILTRKTKVPIGEMTVKEKETLLNLEQLIHQRIINQELAVKEVSQALRRARAEVTVRSGPMGTFLFLGPTGVGKTETSKALAEIYFGTASSIVRLDMSEFQEVKDISRLLGSPGEEGLLTTQIRKTPFSLLLLDEIEKTHSNILNLFLQVLDEGYLTDGLGRKVDFKNTIIIATSNAGYQIILQALKEKGEWSEVKQKLLDYIFKQGIFRPEFINRFDAVVVFKPLSKENLLAIVELMLQKVRKNLKEKGIDFEITLSLKEKIVELGYDPTFGARQVRRVLQDKVENILAIALLSGSIQRGDKIEIDSEEFKIIKIR